MKVNLSSGELPSGNLYARGLFTVPGFFLKLQNLSLISLFGQVYFHPSCLVVDGQMAARSC
jgi:hypothetical protein